LKIHSSGGDKGFSQCGMKWKFSHLFGVEVVAVLSVGVPVLDTDSGPPLTAADFRDAVAPQSRGDRRRMSASSVIGSVYV